VRYWKGGDGAPGHAWPEQYAEGYLNDWHRTPFNLDVMDFARIEKKLHFKISCDKFACELNKILAARGCHLRFTCYNADSDPDHITPSVLINTVFRDP
jgi:hypothetical protein